MIDFAYDETICLIVSHHVVSYDYDHDLVVLIVMIGGLPIVEAQISMNTRHYYVGYCVYSATIDHHHEMMDRFHRHHRHQAHRSILRADYPGHSVCELGHVLIEHRRYLMVCRSDQI